MNPSVRREVAALRTMPIDKLRRKHLEVFGEETRSCNKEHLRKKIAWRIQAQAEGGLSERARRRALEIANDADLRVRMPRAMVDGDPAEIAARSSTSRYSGNRDPRLPFPGTLLVREFKGHDIVVKVLAEGYKPTTSDSIPLEGTRVVEFRLDGDPSFDARALRRERGGPQPSEPYVITGTVVDPNGRPVPDAAISIRPLPVPETVTDAEGKFKVRCPPPMGSSMEREVPYVIARDRRRNLAVAVEFDVDRFEHRRQPSGDRRHPAAAVQGDRGVFVAGQRGRREAAVGVDEDVPCTQLDRARAASEHEHGQPRQHDEYELPPDHEFLISSPEVTDLAY